MQEIVTQDGSITFFSEEYQEKFHSLVGAWEESKNKFLFPSRLLENNQPASVLDIGFGLGYNTLSLIDACESMQKKVTIYALEYNIKIVEKAINIYKNKHKKITKSLLTSGQYQNDLISLFIFWGDARQSIQKIKPQTIDCVFLDPFSPPKNPELWTVEFFAQIKKTLLPSGRILTYSSALPVIRAFMKNGFYVGYTKPVGRKRGGLIASLDSSFIVYPLEEKDLYLLTVSTQGLPNRDKKMWNKDQIQKHREKLAIFLKNKNILLSYKKAISLYESWHTF